MKGLTEELLRASKSSVDPSQVRDSKDSFCWERRGPQILEYSTHWIVKMIWNTCLYLTFCKFHLLFYVKKSIGDTLFSHSSFFEVGVRALLQRHIQDTFYICYSSDGERLQAWLSTDSEMTMSRSSWGHVRRRWSICLFRLYMSLHPFSILWIFLSLPGTFQRFFIFRSCSYAS